MPPVQSCTYVLTYILPRTFTHRTGASRRRENRGGEYEISPDALSPGALEIYIYG